jgi:hypothetical protein
MTSVRRHRDMSQVTLRACLLDLSTSREEDRVYALERTGSPTIAFQG